MALAAVSAFLGWAPTYEVVEAALASVVVPGRLEVLGSHPLVVVDGAHNPSGAEALSQALVEAFSVAGRRVAVLGMLHGRDPVAIVRPLAEAGIDHVVCVAPETPRAMTAEVVAAAASEVGLTSEVAASIAGGVEAALRLVADDGLLVVTGSLYVVGDARAHLLDLLAGLA